MRYGVDISSNNVHPINYGALVSYLKDLGGGTQPFVIVKITQGTGYINPDAVGDIQGCHAAGALVAGYIMDEGGDNVGAEVALYRKAVGNLPLTDDIELSDGLSVGEYIAHTAALIAQEPSALVYLNQTEVAQGFPGGGGLWLAEYNGTPGVTTYPCLVHQFSDVYPVPGLKGQFDVNVWCGSEQSFDAFFGIVTPDPIDPPLLAKPACGLSTTPTGKGYWLVAQDGGVLTFGDAHFAGSLGKVVLSAPIVGMAHTPTGKGYWLVGADGGVFAFGDAPFAGSAAKAKLAAPIVGMAATPTGKGYWLVGADGGVFSFGDAHFYGSTGGTKLAAPITAMAVTPTGKGYWFCGADGGVFTFGDAKFYGSTGNVKFREPMVGMSSSPSGKGYCMVAADGGLFSFGDAAFEGSAGGQKLVAPVVGMTRTLDGKGYWMVGADGGVFSFGDAHFYGSAG